MTGEMQDSSSRQISSVGAALIINRLFMALGLITENPGLQTKEIPNEYP